MPGELNGEAGPATLEAANDVWALGDGFVELDRSLHPDAVTAELYRANAIENYDTAMLRAAQTSGLNIEQSVSLK